MTDSSSKLLQIQGKWYQERQKINTWAQKTEPNVKAVKGCIYFSGGQGQKDKKHWNAAS